MGFEKARALAELARQTHLDERELRERIAKLVRRVEADPKTFGVLSTGEACAVALLLGRLDLLNKFGTQNPLDALERLGPDWEKAVRDLHREGW